MNALSQLLARFTFLRCLALLGLILGSMTSALAAKSYSDNSDGTVTDPTTGLTWMRCSMGQTWEGMTCTGKGGTYTFDQANALTGTVTFAGQGDWRLPNIRELQTIVDTALPIPTIDLQVFPNTRGATLWSSTPVSNAGFAFDVSFADGHTGYGFSYLYEKYNGVRLVRGAQASTLLNPTRPTTDYIDHLDGTVTHIPTGLMWQRCSVGQIWNGTLCNGIANSFTLDTAKQLSSIFFGKTDWRLPTVEELLSLIDYSRVSPAINITIFNNTSSSVYLSGSSSTSNSSGELEVSFDYGTTYTSYYRLSRNVRLVRGGLPFAPISLAKGWNLLGNGMSQPLTVAHLLGDAMNVTSVWKWDVASTGWQFYAPSMDAATLQSYASGKGYGVLSSINPSEGFWVNAIQPFSVAQPSGTAITGNDFAAGKPYALQPSWNLVAIGVAMTPSDFNKSLSATLPATGSVPMSLTTLWAWDSAAGNWYFYAPSLEATGGLVNYISTKGYLDFGVKRLDLATGFWVNKP